MFNTEDVLQESKVASMWGFYEGVNGQMVELGAISRRQMNLNVSYGMW